MLFHDTHSLETFLKKFHRMVPIFRDWIRSKFPNIVILLFFNGSFAATVAPATYRVAVRSGRAVCLWILIQILMIRMIMHKNLENEKGFDNSQLFLHAIAFTILCMIDVPLLWVYFVLCNFHVQRLPLCNWGLPIVSPPFASYIKYPSPYNSVFRISTRSLLKHFNKASKHHKS